jgi:hypothetical protein
VANQVQRAFRGRSVLESFILEARVFEVDICESGEAYSLDCCHKEQDVRPPQREWKQIEPLEERKDCRVLEHAPIKEQDVFDLHWVVTHELARQNEATRACSSSPKAVKEERCL